MVDEDYIDQCLSKVLKLNGQINQGVGEQFKLYGSLLNIYNTRAGDEVAKYYLKDEQAN